MLIQLTKRSIAIMKFMHSLSIKQQMCRIKDRSTKILASLFTSLMIYRAGFLTIASEARCIIYRCNGRSIIAKTDKGLQHLFLCMLLRATTPTTPRLLKRFENTKHNHKQLCLVANSKLGASAKNLYFSLTS